MSEAGGVIMSGCGVLLALPSLPQPFFTWGFEDVLYNTGYHNLEGRHSNTKG